MNTTQRKFLIDRIKEKTNKKISELENQKIRFPSASNYIFKAVLTGELKLQPKEVTLEAIKKKALNAKEGENWMSEMRMGWEKERTIQLNIQDLIELPDDYAEAGDEARKNNRKIDEEIKILKSQLETLEVRIQLASNSTLQKLINEVDDMGDLSLMDNKLKLLE